MSTTTTGGSTNKRPLDKEESEATKTETKVSSDQTSATTAEEQQPSKKAKLEEEEKSKDKKSEDNKAEGKNEANKEEVKETKASPEKAAPEKVEKKEASESKPETKPSTTESKEENKPPSVEAKPATPAAAAPAAATGTATSRPELSEKDQEGRIRKPTNDDILLGRGKPFQNHPGNQRMLKIVDEHKERYLSEKRDKKRAIVEQVLDIIQKDGARFLKRIDHGEYWREVETTVSFEKVSHALRSKVRRPEGFEVNQNNASSAPKGPLPILPEGGGAHGHGGPGAMASLYNPQLLAQQRGMFPDAMGLHGLMPSPFGLMPNMFTNPNLMRGLQQATAAAASGGGGGGPAGAPGAPTGSDLEQLVRSQMVDSLLRQRQQLDEALNDVAGGMRLPPNYK